MNYKLKYNLTHSAENCLNELLTARGVENIEGYVNPSVQYELDPYLLDNIESAAKLLYKHLEDISVNIEIDENDKITYEKEKSQRSYSTNSQDGRWVTINGNHVFIEND